MKIQKLTNWELVKESALNTIGKKLLKKEPDENWKYRILYSEHSPIRSLIFRWIWENIMYWVSVHFVRHKFGIEHFVETQRTDRTGLDRNLALQNSKVNHSCIANAQTIINISKVRLCKQASKETTEKWEEFLDELSIIEPELFELCVPSCVYRGFCPEIKTCGYSVTSSFKEHRNYYVNRCLRLQQELK